MTTTMTTVRNNADGGPSTAERKLNAETQLRRNLAITDSARERIRSKLIDVPIEDSPVKRERSRTKEQDEELLSKIRGVSPASSVSSNDSTSGPAAQRPMLLAHRLLSARHKQTPSTPSYVFPNEYSIPTIPLPPSPSLYADLESLKPPESPPRFRRRDKSAESTPTKPISSRESSVRFNIPSDESDILPNPSFGHSQSQKLPLTSTPNPVPTTSRIQKLLDQRADAFDSAKSYISAYYTPQSPPRGTPARFKRTTAPSDSPSKLLRTLSRATSSTPSITPIIEESEYHDVSHFQTAPTPALKGRVSPDSEELSLDEADKTLDSIIESTEDASTRIRRVLEQSRRERSARQSLSPSRTNDETYEDVEEPVQAEMSVWGDKSFFRRMAMKVPGGWAFTPQPKLRTVTLQESQPQKDNGEEVIKDPSLGKWWGFWRAKRKSSSPSVEDQNTPPNNQELIVKSPPKNTNPRQQARSFPERHISPPKPIDPSSSHPTPSLSNLSEKRLRLARSLKLLQSDIRLAREGIETLESRLESITLASAARQIDSDRRLTLRRARGDPPPIITLPAEPQTLKLRPGTYVWLPFQRGWIVWILWIVLLIQGVVIWSFVTGRDRLRWEPYSFGEWARDEKWPT